MADLERFILFPIKEESLYDMYLKAVASFWTVSEVNLTNDVADWESLSDDERHFVLTVLAFFATSDRVVNLNLAKNFSIETTIPEASQFYDFQIGVEAIHTQMYGTLIEFYEKNEEKRTALFKSIMHVDCIRKKATWALEFTNSFSASFAERLIAFACVEGIFFSASFCAIFYFKKRGLLPGLAFSNELISRDEGLHRDFACLYYRTKCERLSDERVHAIVASAVDCEMAFVQDALRVDIIGMNSDLMYQYVKSVADHLLASLGHSKYFFVPNPFDWMDLISLPGKTNFFEKRVGEYAKAGTMQDESRNQFLMDDDF